MAEVPELVEAHGQMICKKKMIKIEYNRNISVARIICICPHLFYTKRIFQSHLYKGFPKLWNVSHVENKIHRCINCEHKMGYVNEVFDVDVRFAKCSSSICIGNNANKFIDFRNNAERLAKDEDEHQSQEYSCLLRCPA